MIKEGSKRWESTTVGYHPFLLLRDFVHANWPGFKDLTAPLNGFFFFTLETPTAIEDAIEGGPCSYHGQPIVLQRWVPGLAL
ncbi:UNVERIFIED_CONTAM: hypothetical protein Slati_2467800 [Sesamum latifolium]|uniref:Uncharacterized protein n=1 Tax=Sesamum latifolium TaxID=2727402 RepID=A0AAW2WET4_9LAMI